MDENDLVRQSKEGDGEAFGALVNAYQAKVFKMAYSLTRNREVADDLAQEVFIKAYFALPKFKEKSQFGTWLYRITINHTKDHLRKTGPLKHVTFEENMGNPAAQKEETIQKEQEMDQKRKSRAIHESLGTLPEKYRTILSLRDMQGFAYEDISRILNISPGTVDSRLHRARKMLRKKVLLCWEKEGGRV
jgi:RNA polymerase sigma-70 factor (ECF subfamily)